MNITPIIWLKKKNDIAISSFKNLVCSLQQMFDQRDVRMLHKPEKRHFLSCRPVAGH